MAGMRGTGSCSFEVGDLFVPMCRTIGLARAMDGSVRSESDSEPVYRTSFRSISVSIAGQ